MALSFRLCYNSCQNLSINFVDNEFANNPPETSTEGTGLPAPTFQALFYASTLSLAHIATPTPTITYASTPPFTLSWVSIMAKFFRKSLSYSYDSNIFFNLSGRYITLGLTASTLMTGTRLGKSLSFDQLK